MLVGVIVMVGAWVYLSPVAAPTEYFRVTVPPGSQAFIFDCWTPSLTCDIQANSKDEVLRKLGGASYTSIAGPFPAFIAADQSPDPGADGLRAGLLATLIAFVAFGLLGFSERFRRLEARLGDASAALGRWLGATTRAKIGNLLLVAAGAISCAFASLVLYSEFERLSDYGFWWQALGSYSSLPAVGLAALISLFTGISIAALGVIAAVVRRTRISRHLGPFLVGYAGLLVGLWLLPPLAIGVGCAADPGWLSFGPTPGAVMVTPFACVASFTGLLYAEDEWFPSLPVFWTLYWAIPVVFALLVRRAHRRHQRLLRRGPIGSACATLP